MDLRVCHGVAGDNRFRISLLPGANADLRDVTFISPQQAVRQIALAVLLCDV
jgi:hypothetical protein